VTSGRVTGHNRAVHDGLSARRPRSASLRRFALLARVRARRALRRLCVEPLEHVDADLGGERSARRR
jgi:hypothetical protein